MPHKPERYPPDWKAISQYVRFEKYKGICQHCGAEHKSWRVNRKGKRVQVILTTAHLDHDESNCEETNLLALCMSCHLIYDRMDNQQRAKYGYLPGGSVKGLPIVF